MAFALKSKSLNSNSVCCSQRVAVCCGTYPERLLQEWDRWDEENGSENDRPGSCLFLFLFPVLFRTSELAYFSSSIYDFLSNLLSNALTHAHLQTISLPRSSIVSLFLSTVAAILNMPSSRTGAKPRLYSGRWLSRLRWERK